MNYQYSIGIVTYHARFDKYFKPLIQKLSATFPDKEILCVLNGHPDRTLQIGYLKKASAFLSQLPNVRYLTYDQHQSLAKCWNQVVILSDTDSVLMLNDDTQVTELFREEFEKKAANLPFSTINKSWSHFLVSKEVIRKAGWFDERFLGIGHEDFDYGMRMTMVGLPVTNTACLGIKNYVAPQENPSWKDISGNAGGNRYSMINQEFFKTKWICQDGHPEMKYSDFKYAMRLESGDYRFSPLTEEPTPMFYDYGCLDIRNEAARTHNDAHKLSGVKIASQKIFYTCREMLKKVYRSIIR